MVNNVETLFNIAQAAGGIPVTEKFLTVSGCVANPLTTKAPVGTRFKDLLQLAGGATVPDYRIFVSGLIYAKLTAVPWKV